MTFHVFAIILSGQFLFTRVTHTNFTIGLCNVLERLTTVVAFHITSSSGYGISLASEYIVRVLGEQLILSHVSGHVLARC